MPKPVITEGSSAPELAADDLFMFPARYWPAGVLEALARSVSYVPRGETTPQRADAVQAWDDAIVAAAAGAEPPPVQ